MSVVAGQARALAARLLPVERTAVRPSLEDVDAALRELRTMSPRDAYDEAAFHEAGALLLRLRDGAERREG